MSAMLPDGWRRATAIYLALFFVAAAAAPHHHINGFEDLLLDQPSDSGWVVEHDGPIGTRNAPAFDSFWLVDDDPCLACFSNDFVSVATAVFAFTPLLERLAIRLEPVSKTTPSALPHESSSRAPPALG